MNRLLDLEGIGKVEKVSWKDIEPGMIFLGGVRINDTIPFELRDFPVLSSSLLEELSKKYYFLSRRDLLVVKPKFRYSPSKLSRELREAGEMIDAVNSLRSSFAAEKQRFISSLSSNTPLWETDVVEQNTAVTSRYNSFHAPSSPVDSRLVPSLFHDLHTPITIGHLLTGTLQSRFHLPVDEEVLLHLVVDCSRGMEQGDTYTSVFSALNFFYKNLRDIFKDMEIIAYAFSEECKPVPYPVSGKEVPRGDSYYATFIKKVLHHKDTSRKNKVILFSDKEPADPDNTAHYGRLFKKNNIDFTQIILGTYSAPGAASLSGISDDDVSSASQGCSRAASVCGGNLLILLDHRAAAVAALECYDRYIGLLTFLDPLYSREQKAQEIRKVKGTQGYERKTGKVVKKWQPKVIKRKP